MKRLIGIPDPRLVCLVVGIVTCFHAQAAVIDFGGQLDVVQKDIGGAVYSGVPIGSSFFGSIDDVTMNGFISDGTTLTSFGCCIAAGNAAPGGDLTFTLGPNESKQFNSLDYENGNAGKGLTGGLGDGTGKWQCLVTSDLDLEVMSLIRTPDGFVTSVTDVVPISSTGVNEIYFANPASNQNQQSFLRVVNRSSVTGLVTH